MTVARAFAVHLSGIDGRLVELRADLGAGPAPAGLLDQLDVAETTDRIRAAVQSSGLPWPAGPVRLSLAGPATPARLAALCGADLAVACAVLAAAGHLLVDRLEHTVLAGDLGPDGQLRPVRGVLPALLAARQAGLRLAVVPQTMAPEGSLVGDMLVMGADRFHDVVAYMRGEHAALSLPGPPAAALVPAVDLADVHGQSEAAATLEVAAAGGQHLLLLGQPGSGATLLARCPPGLLPDLTPAQALEVTAIHSSSGLLNPRAPLITRPPFVAPHHSSSLPALIGGGAGVAKPGAISRAHFGVLFLDEAGEWGHQRLESLRFALEEGEIRLARRDGIARYPARAQLVLASPLCPFAQPEPDCTCTAPARRRHLAHLTGPLLDRIDLRVRLRPAPPGTPRTPASDSTEVVRQRVQHARQRAAHRWADHGAATNAEVPATVLRRDTVLPAAALAVLDRALTAGSLTRRGADRCLRVAWTLADLAGRPQPEPEHIAQALPQRDGKPS